METMMVVALLTWIVLFGAIGAALGEKKGIGGQGFAVGALLGPLGVLFVLVASGNRVRCPSCRESVDPEASVCPHCQQAIKSAFNAKCGHCGKGFNLAPAALGHVARCPHCKKMTPTKKPIAT